MNAVRKHVVIQGKTPPSKASQKSIRVMDPAASGRLGLGAFFKIVLNFGSFPFHRLVLPSPIPKMHTFTGRYLDASHWPARKTHLSVVGFVFYRKGYII
jgi:hypothetical protein